MALVLVLAALFAACGTADPPSLGGTGGNPIGDGGHLVCTPGTAGCSCSQAGKTAACGTVVSKSGNSVLCSMGHSTCDGQVWGPCVGSTVVTKSFTPPTGGLRALALGSSMACGANEPCDPYCNQVIDDPTSGLTPPAGFTAGPSGLTLSGTLSVPCTSLTVTPASSSVTVTSLTNPGSVALKAQLAPAGCAPSTFPTTWAVDQAGQASISGTDNTDGLLTLGTPLPGTIHVTAYAGGVSGSAPITIKIDIVDTLGIPSPNGALGDSIAPDVPAGATQCGAFYGGTCPTPGGAPGTPASGTTPSTATWLYPYAATYLPLGLPAPVMMYKFATLPAANSAVKLSLRYPAGSTEAASTFNYATIITESKPDPRVYILQSAWQRFEQTARGQDASLVIQRWTGGLTPTLENETAERIHFVNGQLKGTVYYTSYSSPQGNNTGAVLSIAPGATSPTLAVQPNGTCTVCHSLNVPGSKLIVNGLANPTYSYDQSQQYDMTMGGFPSPPVLNSYTSPSTGDIFTYGGARTDGSLYMSHWGDGNWHQPSVASGLYSTSNASAPLSVTGWPANMKAVTPRFSPDGSKLAFAFWGGTSLAQSPSGTLAQDTTGATLAVVDFTCGAGCTSGYAVSNARAVTGGASFDAPLTGGATFQVTTGSSTVYATGSLFTSELVAGQRIAFGAQPGKYYVVGSITSSTQLALTSSYTGSSSTTSTATREPWAAWPSFLPDGSAVLYQRQLVSAKASISWSPTPLNTIGGSQADIWISNVPADGSTAATPTRLSELNGLNGSGASYLPKTSRDVSPVPTPYHSGGQNVTFNEADNCSKIGTAKNVYDYQVNYLPAVNPTQTAGMNWVLFTTRRMYGNIAYANQWDAEPATSGACSTCIDGTGALIACSTCIPGFSCSHATPAKKLWIAALDATFTPGTDPSHPAFFLPGQELAAGNSNGYWVNTPCAPVGASCSINDDCCGGSGSSPTNTCKITTAPSTKTCQPVASACVPAGSVCNTAGSPGDCCTGLTCPGAGGLCFQPSAPIYTEHIYTREFVASCPVGTRVQWGYFQWQATIPDNTSIDFSVQTKELATDTYAPDPPLDVGSATVTTGPGTWDMGPNSVDTVLTSDGLVSKPYLLVTMDFFPSPDASSAPSLQAWQQQYDCVPAE